METLVGHADCAFRETQKADPCALCVTQDLIEGARKSPDLLAILLEALCKALTSAYQQIVNLAIDDTLHRLVKILIDLAARLGPKTGKEVELPTYLTQEEIAQMVTARRENFDSPQFSPPQRRNPLLQPWSAGAQSRRPENLPYLTKPSAHLRFHFHGYISTFIDIEKPTSMPVLNPDF
jgi:hypothetical protein